MSEVPLNLLQNLNIDAIIELFVLDLSGIGGQTLYFHAGTNNLGQNLVWQGQEYTRFPIEAEGFQQSGSGPAARPTLRASNILSAVTALALSFDDLIGAPVIRKRTMKQFLDAVNFAGGVNPSADPTRYYEDETYLIERKVNENRKFVEFELVSKADLQGKLLPARQIIENSCTWRYRGAECGYNGTNYFTSADVATGEAGNDVCGKRLSSCRLRFGENEVLPFGAFPGAGLISGG